MKQELHQVEVPATKKGTIKFGVGQLTNPTPDKLTQVVNGINVFAVGLIGLVSGTDLFTGYQAKVINFSLAVLILLLTAIKVATGVESPNKQ